MFAFKFGIFLKIIVCACWAHVEMILSHTEHTRKWFHRTLNIRRTNFGVRSASVQISTVFTWTSERMQSIRGNYSGRKKFNPSWLTLSLSAGPRPGGQARTMARRWGAWPGVRPLPRPLPAAGGGGGTRPAPPPPAIWRPAPATLRCTERTLKHDDLLANIQASSEPWTVSLEYSCAWWRFKNQNRIYIVKKVVGFPVHSLDVTDQTLPGR